VHRASLPDRAALANLILPKTALVVSGAGRKLAAGANAPHEARVTTLLHVLGAGNGFPGAERELAARSDPHDPAAVGAWLGVGWAGHGFFTGARGKLAGRRNAAYSGAVGTDLGFRRASDGSGTRRKVTLGRNPSNDRAIGATLSVQVARHRRGARSELTLGRNASDERTVGTLLCVIRADIGLSGARSELTARQNASDAASIRADLGFARARGRLGALGKFAVGPLSADRGAVGTDLRFQGTPVVTVVTDDSGLASRRQLERGEDQHRDEPRARVPRGSAAGARMAAFGIRLDIVRHFTPPPKRLCQAKVTGSERGYRCRRSCQSRARARARVRVAAGPGENAARARRASAARLRDLPREALKGRAR